MPHASDTAALRTDGPLPAGVAPGAGGEEWALVARLQAGDEAAFVALVERYHADMIRVAAALLGSRASAEDVAQEAWLGAVKNAGAFEGRSSVKTWLFRILSYCAWTRRGHDERAVPFSALALEGDDEPAVDPDRFQAEGELYGGNWSRPPEPWAEARLAAAQAARLVEREIEHLPHTQRAVITLRDVEGLDAAEVCALLGISEGNQRVLLHRARSRVRSALERHLSEEPRP